MNVEISNSIEYCRDTCSYAEIRADVQEYKALGGMEGRAVCGGCHVSTSRDFQSGRTTYLPTGEDITKPLLIKKVIETWNHRAERTCRIGYEYEGEPFFHAIHVHELTCGHDVRLFEDVPRYCPYCGARVVDE